MFIKICRKRPLPAGQPKELNKNIFRDQSGCGIACPQDPVFTF